MPLTVQSFTVEDVQVRSDVQLNKAEFLSRFAGALHDQASSLDPLPAASDVDYIKVENGEVSIVLK